MSKKDSLAIALQTKMCLLCGKQLLETEAGRDLIHSNIWVNALFADYKALNLEKRSSMGNILDYSDCDFPNWIITDVRFPNEVQAIKSRGGLVIQITRKSQNTERLDTDWDYVIDNNGDLQGLLKQVQIMATKLNLI